MKRTGWNDREASWTERNAPLPDDCEKNHEHTDACWEPDSGCDMGKNPDYVRPATAEERAALDAAFWRSVTVC